jgi:DNA-binding transcriptional LysR family regulator
MDLPALADFHLVVDHGGFGRASRASGRPKATLSRKVSELEANLGVRLIDRGSRTLRLTDEGRELHERTAAALTEIAEAELSVSAGASVPKGRLRVSAPIVFGHVLLSQVAVAFVAAYPQVELEIVTEDRKIDPVEENYDLVIRIDPSPDDRLVGRRIMEDERVLVAPPGLPVTVGQDAGLLEQTPAVRLAGTPSDILWRVDTHAGERLVAPQFRLTFSSFLMVREAVIAGAGCALMPRLLVHGDVASGRLVSHGIHHGPKVEIWALQNTRRLSSTKVRAFMDAVASLNRGAESRRGNSGGASSPSPA